VADWGFLTNHGRALVAIAHDPRLRLRDLAAALDITERTAYEIVADLTEAGYVVKQRDGRRNRYEIQNDRPLRESIIRERTVDDVLELLVDTRRGPGWEEMIRRPTNCLPDRV
jgi:DNA-binding transcriptional ArsR family regulator